MKLLLTELLCKAQNTTEFRWAPSHCLHSLLTALKAAQSSDFVGSKLSHWVRFPFACAKQLGYVGYPSLFLQRIIHLVELNPLTLH